MSTDTQAIVTRLDTWLSEHGVTVQIHFIGDACPPFCTDKAKPGIGVFPRRTHVHGHNFRAVLTRDSGKWKHGPFNSINAISVEFWNSYRDAELGALGCEHVRQDRAWVRVCGKCRAHGVVLKDGRVPVKPIDVLSCATLRDVGRFEEFCMDFGYDVDSRKAESVWRACNEQAADFARMFTREELEELEGIVREY